MCTSIICFAVSFSINQAAALALKLDNMTFEVLPMMALSHSCTWALAMSQVRAPDARADPRLAVPFHRAYNGVLQDHFYTTDPAEVNLAATRLGYAREGIAAYIFKDQQPGTILYPHLQPHDL